MQLPLQITFRNMQPSAVENQLPRILELGLREWNAVTQSEFEAR